VTRRKGSWSKRNGRRNYIRKTWGKEDQGKKRAMSVIMSGEGTKIKPFDPGAKTSERQEAEGRKASGRPKGKSKKRGRNKEHEWKTKTVIRKFKTEINGRCSAKEGGEVRNGKKVW